MRLQKLKLTNIRSYESAELEFPDCSLLLSGDIGSGKTSILMAIEYALFGLQPGQKGSALLRNKALSGGVTLEFEINGEPVIIERALKREGKSVSNDYSAITINGEKTESSVTELKTKILQLLNYPPEFLKKNNLLYRYTVYTPQEQMKQIILEDPEVRLNILGHVFGIDKYKKIRENLAIILNKLKEDSKLLTGEIKTLDSDKSRLESTKNLVKTVDTRIEKKREEFILLAKKRGDIEKEVKELEEKIREKEIFEKEVEKTNVMIASKRENIFPLEKEMRELNRSLNETGGVFSEELLSQKKEQIKLKRDELERLNAQYVSLLSKISSLEETKRSTFEKKERVFKIDMCPTCLQNVPHAHKHNILNETERQLVELTASISSLENEKPGIKSAIDRTKLEIPKIEEEKMRLEILKSKISFIEKSRKRLDEIARLKATLESDLAFLSSHMDSLKENISEFSKFNNLYRVKQLDLERAFNDEKKCEISLAEFKKEKELM
ncbi:MAG: SMC family ATPase, partial [archaeon]|nr:SMC family ATPase [archaeon]